MSAFHLRRKLQISRLNSRFSHNPLTQELGLTDADSKWQLARGITSPKHSGMRRDGGSMYQSTLNLFKTVVTIQVHSTQT